MRLRLTLLSFLAIANLRAFAQESFCETAYRQAFVDYPWATKRSQEAREAHQIYAIFFDYVHGVDNAYANAQELFRLLSVGPEGEDAVLKDLVDKMRSGELCVGGRPKRLTKIIKILKTGPLRW